MKYLLILLMSTNFACAKPLAVADFTQEADQFLNKYVKNGLVDYKSVKQNMDGIEGLYKQVGEMSVQDMGKMEKKAFYINAYNLIVIRQIAKNYPLKSPMDVEGFFDKQKHKVAGEMLALNELEKQKLIAPYKDARVHFVLVCAALSCPPLTAQAFQADKLEQQMNELTKKALNNGAFIKVNSKKKEVAISKIFDWYGDDFKQEAASVLAYINKYRDKKIPTSHKVSFYEYDWTLNGQ